MKIGQEMLGGLLCFKRIEQGNVMYSFMISGILIMKWSPVLTRSLWMRMAIIHGRLFMLIIKMFLG